LPKKDTALRQKQAKKGSQANKVDAVGKATRAKKSTQLPKHQIWNTKATAALQNPRSKNGTKLSSKAAAATAKKTSLWKLWSTKKSDATQAKVEGQKPKSKKPTTSTSRERPYTAEKSGKIKNVKYNRQLEALEEVMDAIEKFKMHAEKLGISGKELLDAVSEASHASELSPLADPPGMSSSSLSSLTKRSF
jgi:hypothetical protein